MALLLTLLTPLPVLAEAAAVLPAAQGVASSTAVAEVAGVTDAESTPAVPEITPAPTPEPTPAPEAAALPAESPAPEGTPVPEESTAPEATVMPEATEEPGATAAPEATEEPEATAAPEATEESEATPLPTATATAMAEGTATPESAAQGSALQQLATKLKTLAATAQTYAEGMKTGIVRDEYLVVAGWLNTETNQAYAMPGEGYLYTAADGTVYLATQILKDAAQAQADSISIVNEDDTNVELTAEERLPYYHDYMAEQLADRLMPVAGVLTTEGKSEAEAAALLEALNSDELQPIYEADLNFGPQMDTMALAPGTEAVWMARAAAIANTWDAKLSVPFYESVPFDNTGAGSLDWADTSGGNYEHWNGKVYQDLTLTGNAATNPDAKPTIRNPGSANVEYDVYSPQQLAFAIEDIRLQKNNGKTAGGIINIKKDLDFRGENGELYYWPYFNMNNGNGILQIRGEGHTLANLMQYSSYTIGLVANAYSLYADNLTFTNCYATSTNQNAYVGILSGLLMATKTYNIGVPHFKFENVVFNSGILVSVNNGSGALSGRMNHNTSAAVDTDGDYIKNCAAINLV
ncbi:MAG: hypothetical protein PHO10_12065, partial [Gemmiger sp.]|nr:hypothetical protein [Gemmiger sp.]